MLNETGFNFQELFQIRPGVISIVGMAKNAGKTVTMNYLQRISYEQGYLLGLTSVGRDGERYDALTHLLKPEIYVAAGTLIATAESLIPNTKSWERLEETGVHTSLGEVIIFRANTDSAAVLAGPSKNSEAIKVLKLLREWGAETILLDGAFDRQSSADPLISDQVILASGATLGGSLDEVVAKTKARVEQLTLPFYENMDIRVAIEKSSIRIGLFRDGRMEEFPSSPSSLLTREEWLKLLKSYKESILWVQGAIGEGLGEALRLLDHPPLVLVENGSKIFISLPLWRQLRQKEVRFEVLSSIHLSGITINPTYPGGKSLDPSDLLNKMGEALKPLPVADVMDKKIWTVKSESTRLI